MTYLDDLVPFPEPFNSDNARYPHYAVWELRLAAFRAGMEEAAKMFEMKGMPFSHDVHEQELLKDLATCIRQRAEELTKEQK